jgi:hypothetical protein
MSHCPHTSFNDDIFFPACPGALRPDTQENLKKTRSPKFLLCRQTRAARLLTKEMKLWVGVSIATSLLVLVTAGVTIGILVSAWKENVDALWATASTAALTTVSSEIDAHLDAVEFAAKRVPLSGASALLDYYVGYRNNTSAYHIDSLGYLTRAGGAGSGKYSWQIAEYYVCPLWGYFYSDASIHPQFHGYCASATSIDYSTLVYNGTDWGLKPQEAALLDGSLGDVFLPIGSIVGVPTLTYEVARLPYASFADIDLATLVTFLRTQVNVWNGLGIATIVDVATGQVVASNNNNNVDTSNWYAASFITKRSGLEWRTTVAVQNIYDNIQWRIGVAAGIAVGMAVLFALAGLGLIYMCFRRHQPQEHHVFQTSLSDIKDFE